MPSIRSTARVGLRESRRWRGRLALGRLEVDGSTAAVVVRAIQRALVRQPSAEERPWILRIEEVRVRLSASRELVTFTDFGAGTAREASASESAGRPTTAQPVSATTTRTLGQMTRSSKPPQWAYLLFCLVRELQPERGLEMGACVGISASYQSAAMSLNGRGRLMSLEGAETLAERSQNTLRELGLADIAQVKLGAFSHTLASSLADLAPVSWAFIDGHHDGAATLAYTEQILEAAGPEAVLVFDDINWSRGMKAAWQAIVADQRFALTVDLRSVGLAVVSAHPAKNQRLVVPYY